LSVGIGSQSYPEDIVRIRRGVYRFDFSQQLPDIFRLVYDTNIKLASLGSAQLGLGSLRFILNIMASVERVVILLQGCIFDACGSYHKDSNILKTISILFAKK
jgi:hypothetical protein